MGRDSGVPDIRLEAGTWVNSGAPVLLYRFH